MHDAYSEVLIIMTLQKGVSFQKITFNILLRCDGHFQKAASDTHGILAVRQLAGSPGGGMGRRHHSVGHLEGLALQLASPILSDDESSVHQGKIYAYLSSS